MMQIVYFSRKMQFLAEIQHFSGQKMFITPSPAKADGLRSILVESSTSDVVTIAKFTSELMESIWEEEKRPEVKRKSELLLIFGILKNKYFPDLGYEQFVQAYNLFSDLRSFSLNEDALSTVLEEQSLEVKKAIELFWKLLEVTGFLDEHGAYQKIAEGLRSSDEIEGLKKTYIFWGFQHLNGQQVDLLKALSIRYEVIIPFPLSLKDKLKKSDWLSWMRDSKVQEKDLSEIPQSPKASWIKINSREISLSLKCVMKENDQVVLGVSKLSPLHLDIIPSRKVYYKIPHQLVQPEILEMSYELKSFVKQEDQFPDLEAFFQKKKQEVVKRNATEISFKTLKVIELYLDALTSIRNLTDDKIRVDSFFLSLLHEVVTLNQPRTSYVPISSQNLTIDMKDMSSLEDVSRERRVILCIDDRFDEIQGLGQNYTETIQKALSSLGPLKRSELELLFKQWEFHDLLSQGEVIVLMAESTLKHSLIWKRLFLDVNLQENQKKITSPERVIQDQFRDTKKQSFSGSFSASKFQTFLDCPRKFYFNYVDKVFPTVGLENDLDALKSGTISHKIIEVFYQRNLQEVDLPALTKQIMLDFIQEEGLQLSSDKFLRHELVFNHRALNGIRFLKKIEEVLGMTVNWSIEEDFALDETYKLKGKIDCLGRIQNLIFLLDFKSTRFAASTNKEVETLESLQLWAYAKAASVQVTNFEHHSVVMGYVTLDNPAESNLMFSDPDLCEKFKLSKFSKTHFFKEPFAHLFKLANEKMLDVSSRIQNEEIFLARPRKLDVCNFCELNKVCIKSEMTLE